MTTASMSRSVAAIAHLYARYQSDTAPTVRMDALYGQATDEALRSARRGWGYRRYRWTVGEAHLHDLFDIIIRDDIEPRILNQPVRVIPGDSLPRLHGVGLPSTTSAHPGPQRPLSGRLTHA